MGTILASPSPGTAPQEPTAWDGDFAVGGHHVGFRSESILRMGPEGERTLTLSVWYPADADPADETVRVRDYFRGVLQEGQLAEAEGLAEAPAFAAAMTGSIDALSPDAARTGLDARGLARRGAVPAAGTFPIALWSSRHATLLAQAPLSEILASHGFVVATVWSSDPPLTFLWDDAAAEAKLATIEAHTGDLEQALMELRRDQGTDADTVVLAWSYGGQTAARLQERDPRVVGVIGLDANILPARPEESLQLRRPLVFLVGRDTANRGVDRLASLTAPWTSVRFPGLAHGSFNALEGYLPAVLGTSTTFAWSQSGPAARDGYRALARVATTAALALASNDPDSLSALGARLQDAAGAVPVEVSRGGARDH
jgi:dienelactone hydrolase